MGGETVVGLSADELAAFAEPGRATKVARRDLPFAIASAVWGHDRVEHDLGGAPREDPGRRHRRHRRRPPRSGEDVRGPDRARPNADPPRVGAEIHRRPGRHGRSPRGAGRGPDRLRLLAAAVLPRSEAPSTWTSGERPRAGRPARSGRSRSGRSRRRAAVQPVPEAFAMDPATVEEAVRACERIADREGVRGKAVTPYLLACLSERTDGESLEANLALLESNARRAARSPPLAQPGLDDRWRSSRRSGTTSVSSRHPPRRVRKVTGTSTTRARWRSASIVTSRSRTGLVPG